MHTNDTNVIKRKLLVYPELSYKLTGIFYDVHNKLGRHLLEKQYSDSVEIALKEADIPHEREARVFLQYDENKVTAGTADFVVDNKIIIDLKAKKFITKEDYDQMLRYLKAKNLFLGMIVNFRSSYLKPKRVINNELKSVV